MSFETRCAAGGDTPSQPPPSRGRRVDARLLDPNVPKVRSVRDGTLPYAIRARRKFTATEQKWVVFYFVYFVTFAAELALGRTTIAARADRDQGEAGGEFRG